MILLIGVTYNLDSVRGRTHQINRQIKIKNQMEKVMPFGAIIGFPGLFSSFNPWFILNEAIIK
ncbi:hypothetical protein [Bacillus sp. MUM 13]|uniref:hypothetical protein n=1 Tax=Bacillus sp. MUM 13 TaxID=1678001 RepID=UPI0008F5BC40|nr:hypothetical protein [Bacillus sp. MUM 13]OIK13358.1 hypothetical protein BIV59_06270 [Bacillus sp. MUM 13]